jgi:plasmid stability protein
MPSASSYRRFWRDLHVHLVSDIMIAKGIVMAQLIVRNLEGDVKEKLRRRAIAHGRNMEEEIRDILRDAVKDEGRRAARRLGSEIAALFAGIGLDRDIAELRGHPIKPAKFDK